jgi:hypothetical protein
VELAWEVPSSFWWKSDSFMGTWLLKEETLRPPSTQQRGASFSIQRMAAFYVRVGILLLQCHIVGSVASLFTVRSRETVASQWVTRDATILHISGSKVDAEETTLKSLAFSMAIRFVRLSPRETKDIDR